MDDRQQDNELRAWFAAQRRTEASQAPSFEAMMARARAEAANPRVIAFRPRLRRVLYAGGLAAAATIALIFVVPRESSDEAAFEEAVRAFHSDPALGAWRSPTDGLLDLPGSRWISTVPRVGTPQ